MEITEQAIHLLVAVATEMQARFADFTDLAHGFEHVQRVYHLALHLAEQEHADGFIVGMAALLHDLGRTTRGPTRSHAERSAALAAKLLASYDLPHETQHAILHAILAHSYRHGAEPATLEARVLYDADRLDSLGASGVMRWAMTTKHGRWPETRTYHPDDPFALWRIPDGQRYLLDSFFTKLLLQRSSLALSFSHEKQMGIISLYCLQASARCFIRTNEERCTRRVSSICSRSGIPFHYSNDIRPKSSRSEMSSR